MKVKLLISRAGPGGAHSPGDEIEVGDAEGKRMIEAGQASPVRNGVKPERAVPQGRGKK